MKYDRNKILFDIDKPLERAFRQKAIEIGTKIFEDGKEAFLEKFLDDPTTQEIKAGEEGNPVGLFGFIGFDIDEDPTPIENLYEFLKDNITLSKYPVWDSKKKVYTFTVNIPTKDEIADVTPMPWGTARSWVFAIESGISGLNNYLATTRLEPPISRSGGGIQIKGNTLLTGYVPRPYMSSMLKFLQDYFK